MIDKKSLNVDVKEIPEMHVAYVRHIGPYKGDPALFERLFTKLFMWAGARDLLHIPEAKVMSVYHDNPEVTDESKLNNPEEHPEHKHIVDIYLPVKPL